MITIGQCLRMPVFSPSVLLAGDQGLQNPVRWAHVVDEPNISFWVVPELIVFTTGRNHTDTNYWESIVTDLSEKNVSGLVVALGKYVRSIPQGAIKLASEKSFPIISLPWDLPFIKVTEAIHKQIILHHIDEWKKVSKLQLQMTSAVKHASSLADLVSRFSLLSRLPVQIAEIDKEPSVSNKRYQVPIHGHSSARWYLSLNRTHVESVDQLLLQQMTSLCSVYLLKEQLSKHNEWEFQASFLDNLIDSTASKQELTTISLRIRNWGFPIDKMMRLLLVTIPEPLKLIDKARNTLESSLTNVHSLVTIRGDAFVVVISETANRHKPNFTSIFDEYFHRFPSCQGVASNSIDKTELSETLTTLQKILIQAPKGQISLLSNLIFPQIISELPANLMHHFLRLTWHRITEPVLRDTLLALINNGGHRTRASEALGIHRNTLRHRIDSIESLLEHSLTPEFLTQLHLGIWWDKPHCSVETKRDNSVVSLGRTMHSIPP